VAKVLRVVVLALSLPVVSAEAAGYEFVTAFRDSSGAYALTQIGELYQAHGHAVTKAFTFSDAAGRPYRWPNPPKSFVRWHGEWVVCDNSGRLLWFSNRGTFVRATNVPVRADRLAIAGDALIVHNVIANTMADQFWTTVDGKSVARVPIADTRRFESPLENLLVLAGGRHGEIYSAPFLGPPIVHLVWPADRRRDIAVAYSRTAFRASLERPTGVVDDVAPYSQPLRDLYPLEDGGLAVLRNREDIRGHDGKTELMVGRRVDRYDRAGRQTATAEFPSRMRWVIAVTPRDVTAVSPTGDIATVTWAKPLLGEIIK
jgi:hypothetical protein